MKMKKTQFYILILLVVLAVLLGACGKNTNESGEELDGDALITQIVLTAWAGGTQTAIANPPTPTFTPTIAPTNTQMPTLASPTVAATTPTATLALQQGTGGNTSASSCDSASFVSDVTIPDGTQIDPKTDFTKTWEVKNTGTCTWNAAYQIVFYGGEQMGAEATSALTGSEVAPGESVQVSIDMTAPADDGEYTSYWVLRNANGQNFFVDGGSVYLQIKVGKTATNTPGPTATPTTASVNTAPTISVSPSTTTADTATEITFTATVSDAEDGTASLEVTWDFGDGGTGTGASAGHTFTTDGSYTVTGTVKDSGGKTATATVDVTITAAP